MISQKFKAAIKLADRPAYRIAQQAGINPNDLSKIMCGILPVKRGDPRVLAVARVLSLSEDLCFAEERDNNAGWLD